MQKRLVFSGIGCNDFCVYFFVLYVFQYYNHCEEHGLQCGDHGGYFHIF